MAELWDIYDETKKKTGRIVETGGRLLEKGEYHIAVIALIMNLKNEILISKRAEYKKYGLMWECNGGSIIAGETSLEGIVREVEEELGIKYSKKEAIFLKELKNYRQKQVFKDIWLFKRNVKDEEITLPDGEAIEYKWVNIEKFMNMIEKGEMVPTIELDRELYEEALKMKQRKSYQYIGQKVIAYIDRPLNTKHPKHGFLYPVNYGYIPNTVSGDGEELDCYILGVDEPLKTFEGDCIAVIHRTNDDDDKLVVVPEGSNCTDKEIRELTNFQEQYFESEIIR
jgi:inorganic pyrophosphatase